MKHKFRIILYFTAMKLTIPQLIYFKPLLPSIVPVRNDVQFSRNSSKWYISLEF